MRERPPVCSECHNGVESVARSHIMCYEQYQSKESKRKEKERKKKKEREEKKELTNRIARKEKERV